MGDHGDAKTIVYYVTGHGLGHLSRSIEIARRLVYLGHHVTMVTAAPLHLFASDLPAAGLDVRAATLDTGALQRDAFTVDQRGSLEAYLATAGGPRRAEILSFEVSYLQSKAADLVVSDIVPLACAAAAAAGVPAVAVSNFSWDFIYSEYLTAAGSSFKDLVWQIADDYACALRLLRLPGHVPMPAFREVIDVPLVVRHARRTRTEVRTAMGLPLDAKIACFIYGGQPPGADWRLHESALPPGWLCLVCGGGRAPGGGDGADMPPNYRLLAEDAYTPDVIEASDVVVGKIGYGTTSECLAHRRPLVFLRRDFFNEEPFLRKLLELCDAAVEMKRRDFLAGNWAPYLERAAALEPRYPEPTNGAEVVAGELARAATEGLGGVAAGAGGGGGSPFAAGAHPGQSRLRDTIAWGYMMGRHASRELSEVPEWYTRGQIPETAAGAGAVTTVPEEEALLTGPLGLTAVDDAFEVLDPPLVPLDYFPDTLRFLAEVASLEGVATAGDPQTLPELRAAAGLFLRGEPLHIARAPGRLDVMGGIADYSGATVLQMPLAEACHVALQLQSPRHQRLWRHMHPRHPSNSAAEAPMTSSSEQRHPEPAPAVRVVSLYADETNRGPAFDMDISELYDSRTGDPISYEDAKSYFRKDPALAWAAYVAGGLVVLMREKGVRPRQGIAILVSSEVPEGKGVSSSAAVEVAALAALAAAHGVELGGRELALLCQKVENLVVGAPCGVMDQMASALGEEDWLLALRCQPAEVEGPVPLPPHLRFWGVDSGIRHSVGGSDYGEVRVGAFMGLKILSVAAAEAAAAKKTGKTEAGSAADVSIGQIESQVVVGGGYLANLAPSAFSKSTLPDKMSGADFLARYGPHLDPATSIDPGKTYAVRVPASHPVHENFRVLAFRQALAAAGTSLRQQLEVLGELMLQSHASYSACGLGSDGTDRLVALVLEERAAAEAAGVDAPLFGAKITGGGCGGTVCVLGTADEAGKAALRRVTQRYEAETGHAPAVFAGSSQGAARFGVLRVLWRARRAAGS